MELLYTKFKRLIELSVDNPELSELCEFLFPIFEAYIVEHMNQESEFEICLGYINIIIDRMKNIDSTLSPFLNSIKVYFEQRIINNTIECYCNSFKQMINAPVNKSPKPSQLNFNDDDKKLANEILDIEL